MAGLHLIKLCVGARSIEDLSDWQAQKLADQVKTGEPKRLFHATFMAPKRQVELLDGGSIFWVIKGVVLVRQRLIGFDEGQRDDGRRNCLLLLDPKLVPVVPLRRRAFQGWRYLSPDDAPADLPGGLAGSARKAQMPPQMARDLAELCLI